MMMTPPSQTQTNNVTVNDVDTIMSIIGEAFGDSETSLGIIAITDIPPFADSHSHSHSHMHSYTALRSKVLKLSRLFATQPSLQETRERCTKQETFYSVGWSHGKEKLEGDALDMGKGSFYANPLTDSPMDSILKRDFGGHGHGHGCATPTTNNDNDTDDDKDEQVEQVQDEEERNRRDAFLAMAKQNPAFYAPNVWPDEEEELPEMEHAMKEMGKLIQRIGIMVAKLCDAYVSKKCPKFTPGKIENVVANSLCCKARLLHYFPIENNKVQTETEDEHTVRVPSTYTSSLAAHDNNDRPAPDKNDMEFSDWCGWHNDHCSLTGLVPAMYLNSTGDEIPCPDPNAGLYIKSRRGGLIQVQIPTNAIAFQVGETTQIHTGGILQATPHAVKGLDGQREECRGVSREAFAVFMEPEFTDDMSIPQGRTIQDAQREESEKYLPKTVRTLRSRWKPDMNFGEFSNATFAAFY